MSYITPSQLIAAPDALAELAQLLAVDAPLLEATFAGASRTDWTAEEIADADKALGIVNEHIARAAGLMNSHLVQRGYTLPLSSTDYPVLRVWAAAIARYTLSPTRDGSNEYSGRHERDYREAISGLKKLAAGEGSLGANDPLAAARTDAVHLVSNERLMTRKSLGAL